MNLLFYIQEEIYMISGAQNREGRSRLTWHSRWFQGVLALEVDDAREDSWRCCFAVLALIGY
jgi:hypothetical protein